MDLYRNTIIIIITIIDIIVEIINKYLVLTYDAFKLSDIVAMERKPIFYSFKYWQNNNSVSFAVFLRISVSVEKEV
jgi:hypothetical protein